MKLQKLKLLSNFFELKMEYDQILVKQIEYKKQVKRLYFQQKERDLGQNS